MAKVYVTQAGSSGGSGGGNLQLLNGAAMDATLRSVADTANTASPLKLSTAGVQTLSKLQITTADSNYIDAEDNSGNNRFTVGRDPASQVVNVDFASNPTGGTNLVGAIRTYTDGVNLSEVMTFRKDGNVGIGTTTPGVKLDVHSASNTIAQFNRTGTGNSQIQHLMTGTARWTTGYVNTNGNYSFYDNVNAVFRANLSNTGRLTIGNGDTVGTGQLTVRGSGSTSATTSLLVQNSAGTAAVTVKDDLTTTFGGRISTPNATILVDGTVQNYYLQTLFGGVIGAYAYPPVSVLFEVRSTTQGFLPPRMTTTQKNAIATPAAGLMVYDTTLNKLCVYTTAWETITSV